MEYGKFSLRSSCRSFDPGTIRKARFHRQWKIPKYAKPSNHQSALPPSGQIPYRSSIVQLSPIPEICPLIQITRQGPHRRHHIRTILVRKLIRQAMLLSSFIFAAHVIIQVRVVLVPYHRAYFSDTPSYLGSLCGALRPGYLLYNQTHQRRSAAALNHPILW